MIEIERWIEARPETVFSYFTDPERFLRWQGRDASIELLEVVAPRRIVFTWGWEGTTGVGPRPATLLGGSSLVEISLESQRGGTLLRLRHEPVTRPVGVA